MPVRRFGWNAQRKDWFEWGVTLKNGRLAWTSLGSSRRLEEADQTFVCECPTPQVGGYQLSPDLLNVLPDGFTIETSHEAEVWWQNAARALERGKLMTIDYGMTADEFVLPERKEGSLRGYYRHHPTSDLLANPGEQDLTAHVNFSALIAAGEASGLKTVKFETQAQFLTKIFSQAWKGETTASWDAARARQFQTLTHPEHLGRSFRLLVQSR
jgi:SAM-dependent MidA family methyltransferase